MKLRVVRLLDWVLRITGTLSLINLMNALRISAKIFSNVFTAIRDFDDSFMPGPDPIDQTFINIRPSLKPNKKDANLINVRYLSINYGKNIVPRVRTLQLTRAAACPLASLSAVVADSNSMPALAADLQKLE
jgi:hypothetical protein